MDEQEFINSINGETDNAVLDSLIIRSIKEFHDDMLLTVGGYAFSFCSELTVVDLPNVTTAGARSFENCTSLTSINMPKLLSVGSFMFTACTALTSVRLHEITTIISSGFSGCTRLKTVDLYKINKINQNAFKSTALDTLIIRRTDAVATLGSSTAFDDTPMFTGAGYIYVPADLVESYKTAQYWSRYSSQFRAIEEHPEVCNY